MSHNLGSHMTFLELLSSLVLFFFFFLVTSEATKYQLWSREELVKLAGYGEDKLSTVIVMGTLLCQPELRDSQTIAGSSHFLISSNFLYIFVLHFAKKISATVNHFLPKYIYLTSSTWHCIYFKRWGCLRFLFEKLFVLLTLSPMHKTCNLLPQVSTILSTNLIFVVLRTT